MCLELNLPLALEPLLGEARLPSIVGIDDLDAGLHRPYEELMHFVASCGVELISPEMLYGTGAYTTSVPSLGADLETMQQAFRRYEKIFEVVASSRRSLFLVTHGLGLSAMANKASAESRRLVAQKQPHMGDYFVLEVMHFYTADPRVLCRSRREVSNSSF